MNRYVQLPAKTYFSNTHTKPANCITLLLSEIQLTPHSRSSSQHLPICLVLVQLRPTHQAQSVFARYNGHRQGSPPLEPGT